MRNYLFKIKQRQGRNLFNVNCRLDASKSRPAVGYDLCDRLGSLAIRYDNFYKRTYGGSNLSLGR